MFVQILFLLIVAHFLCDYPLQGPFLSQAKNRFNPILGVPWYQAMIAHCFIHGGAVFLITQNLYIAFVEIIAHFVIDYRKCEGKLTFNEDQFIHISLKIIYTMIIAYPFIKV